MELNSMDLIKKLQFIGRASVSFATKNKKRFSGRQRIINILGKENGMMQSQLAEILDVRPSSLAEMIKKMEADGDVKREADESDGRIKRVYLTDAGKEKIVESSDSDDEFSNRFFAGLSDQEKSSLGEYLDKIAAGWSDDFKEKSAKFTDPTERFEEIQRLRSEMFDRDWRDMSREERNELKQEFRKRAKEMHFGPFGHPGFHHHGFDYHDRDKKDWD